MWWLRHCDILVTREVTSWWHCCYGLLAPPLFRKDIQGASHKKKMHILLWGHDNNIKRLRQSCHFKASFKPGLSTFSTPRHEPPLFNWPSLVFKNTKFLWLHVQSAPINLGCKASKLRWSRTILEHHWILTVHLNFKTPWQVAFYHGIYRWFDPIQWNFNWCYSFFGLMTFYPKKNKNPKGLSRSNTLVICQNHTAKAEAIHPMYPLTGKNLDPKKKNVSFLTTNSSK